MKKKVLIFILIVLIICCVFTLNEFYMKKTGKAKLPNITIKEGTLSNTSATIIITDNISSHTYGEWFRIDEKVNEKWEEVSRLIDNDNWHLIGYTIDKNDKIELDEDWSNIYGELKPGKYRIVKSYITKNSSKKNYVYAEFTIE